MKTVRFRSLQQGMALISALLLLLVLTMLGVGMFRSFGLQERIAGNTRERQRALHAAESAESYAEWWVASANGANATSGTTCAGVVSTPMVCSNLPLNVTTVPWSIAVQFTPPTMTVGSAGTLNDYASSPEFYLTFLAGAYYKTSGTQINTYQVDATGYGGTTNAVSVVESAFSVAITFTGGTTNSKYVSLGGP
jgi:type IV pilus assembly protein PilX